MEYSYIYAVYIYIREIQNVFSEDGMTAEAR